MGTLRFGIDLDRKGIFNEKCLIYTIRDEHGSPIAFSARNLKYESEKETYEQKRAKIEARADLDELQKKEEVEKLWVPRKYINTAETILFQKRCVLFNFDQAKKSSNKSIVVFEGNADCTTLFAGGIKMAVATCGTAFTTEHLEMVLANGITKIVLVFDPDKGGKEGTARFIKMLEEFGSRPGLEVEIVVMPGILADQSVLVNSLTAHERWIKEIRRRNQGSYLVSIGDNFHLFDMPGMEPGENKVREMSKFISNLPTKHGITTMFTMELPKDTLRAGIRPKYTDSKNSGGISFDSKVNMNIIATQRTRDCLLRTAGSSNRGTVKGSHTEDNSI